MYKQIQFKKANELTSNNVTAFFLINLNFSKNNYSQISRNMFQLYIIFFGRN